MVFDADKLVTNLKLRERHTTTSHCHGVYCLNSKFEFIQSENTGILAQKADGPSKIQAMSV